MALRKYRLGPWLPSVSLGFAAFIFVTTEMLPVGLLPDIAFSMGKTEAATGILLTVYAWMVAALSVPLTVLTGGFNRRSLVLLLLGIFITGNIFSALAGTFVLLMGARICIAMAHAVFWSIATPLAARAAPDGGKARALSIVVVGSSMATVLGVPLGTLLGNYLGWRMAFAAVAAVACVVFAVMCLMLPSTPAANSGSFKSLPGIARNKSLMTIYLLTVVTVSGQFTAMTYFAPFMRQVGGFTPGIVAMLLLVLGGSSIAGSLLGGKFAGRTGHMTLFLPLFLLAVMFLLLPHAVRLGLAGATVFCFVWGAAFTFTTLIYQLRVLGLSPKALDVATSIFSGIFNVGIGGGALIGSRVFVGFGVEMNVYVSAALMALAALLSLTRFVARGEEPVTGAQA